MDSVLTYGLMGFFLASFAALVLVECRYDEHKNTFFDLDDSTVLKGLWCIVVILVHVPAAYQNKVQDMIGSFAYIGVTFFFMTSAYGLKYGAEHKKNYLNGFWIKRLPKLLVPACLINVISVALYSFIAGEKFRILELIHINSWVRVLLLFYLVFWLINYLPEKFGVHHWSGPWRDAAVCAFVIAYSLIGRLTESELALGWPTESLGFVYGILLARFMPEIKVWMQNRWGRKAVLLLALSGIAGLAYLKFKPVAFFGDYCLKIILGIALTALVLILTARFRIGNTVSSFLGGISYEVYLLHGICFTALQSTGIQWNSGVFIWSAIALTIGLSVMVRAAGDRIVNGLYKVIGI
ncbi:MAG: acyltransferase family protein [Faecousia sp.]